MRAALVGLGLLLVGCAAREPWPEPSLVHETAAVAPIDEEVVEPAEPSVLPTSAAEPEPVRSLRDVRLTVRVLADGKPEPNAHVKVSGISTAWFDSTTTAADGSAQLVIKEG